MVPLSCILIAKGLVFSSCDVIMCPPEGRSVKAEGFSLYKGALLELSKNSHVIVVWIFPGLSFHR